MCNFSIRRWLPLCDAEIGMLQHFIREYVSSGVNPINKVDQSVDTSLLYYDLGVVSANCQFYMRCLKAHINGIRLEKYELSGLDNFVKTIEMYDGLVDYCKNRIIETYKGLDILQKVSHIHTNGSSYFFMTQEEIEQLENDIVKYQPLYDK